MDILFGSRKLRELCHDDLLATRTLGAPSATKLRARMDDLRAASNFAVCFVLPGRLHALTGKRAKTYAMTLHGGWRLILELANEPLPLRIDKSPDLTRITAIRVIEVCDYHD